MQSSLGVTLHCWARLRERRRSASNRREPGSLEPGRHRRSHVDDRCSLNLRHAQERVGNNYTCNNRGWCLSQRRRSMGGNPGRERQARGLSCGPRPRQPHADDDRRDNSERRHTARKQQHHRHVAGLWGVRVSRDTRGRRS
jgi:hypothetical protein